MSRDTGDSTHQHHRHAVAMAMTSTHPTSSSPPLNHRSNTTAYRK